MRLSRGTIVSLLFVLPIAFCAHRWHVYSSEFDWKRIPAKFGVANESFGHRGSFCYLLVFKMSEASLRRLRKEGLSFFSDSMGASNLRWSTWRPTPHPLPPDGQSFQYPYCVGSGTGADLDSEASKRAKSELVDSLTKPGSYVSDRGDYILVANSTTGSVIFGGND